MHRGFSLVELSIVLVILGLLVGGVLSGQSLIRAAELRAVTSEYQRYATATNSFRDKYFQLPGDMNNAESFWTTLNATNATCRDTASTSTATCNGDGDGAIEIQSTRSRELFRFWQHLANAGLIEGSYSGTLTNSTPWGVAIGTNAPASKLGRGTWSVVAQADVAVWGGFYNNIFQPTASNWLQFGAVEVDFWNYRSILKTEEAWNIDTKIDDGLPGTGKMTTYKASFLPNCVSSSTSSSATYILNQSGVNCVVLFGI